MQVSVWLMHDNHTFTRLPSLMRDAVVAARELSEPYDMLCPVILTDDDGRDVRRVGVAQIGAKTLTDEQVEAWRRSVIADPEVAMLMGAWDHSGHDAGDEEAR